MVTLALSHVKYILFQLIAFIHTVFFYYSNVRFFVSDFLLFFHYLFISPYRITKRFLQKSGAEDPYVYGETPLFTLDRIAKKCRILSKDVVIELGCGTGRTVFWLSCLIGCKTYGIDYLPTFIRKAKQIKRRVGITNAYFKQEDFLTTDLNEATVIYLYGTSLDEKAIQYLTEQFCNLKLGTKIITVSYPLKGPEFHIEKVFKAIFPWGRANIYLNILSHSRFI